ncbi:hypothetical protein K1719_022563 [Acacia pycnantha]|nr:hypothetical protein K1719_022563 [Acacia pycnantha]
MGTLISSSGHSSWVPTVKRSRIQTQSDYKVINMDQWMGFFRFCNEISPCILNWLERESGHYFDKKHFETWCLLGNLKTIGPINLVPQKLITIGSPPNFELRKQKFLEALDSVNDITFYLVHGQLLVITCGDDKAVKFIFSASIDGKIMAWLYNTMDDITDYDAPGCGYTKLAYNIDQRPVESIGYFAISNNDSYLSSTSGGSISLFILKTFKTLTTFMSPPPQATADQVLKKLRGHSTRVTSLAFSNTLHVLVSADANNKIFLWNVEEWENLKGRHLQMPAGRKPEVPCDTHIQFHPQQINFLVVQDRDLAIYEARELTLVKQWDPILPLLISQADFSADGTEIYVGFVDRTIKILDASNLQPLCRIDPTSYLPPTSGESMYLVAMVANPVKAGQFAVGLSDGNVYVMEPPEAGLKWSTLSRDDDKEAAETSGVGDAN